MNVAVSPRTPVVLFTEPESLGQPEPEILSCVMRGTLSGAAAMSAGAADARRRKERIVDVRVMTVCGSR